MGAQNQSTIEQMTLAIGQQARSASRAMAKASSEQKNRALLNIATAIRRDAAKILAQIQGICPADDMIMQDCLNLWHSYMTFPLYFSF